MRFHLKIMYVTLLGATLGCGIDNKMQRSIETSHGSYLKLSETSGEVSVDFTEPTGTLSLDMAINAALSNNLSLRGAGLGYRSSLYLAHQAGAKPNPELEIEFEEFGGTGDALGVDAIATAVVISQEVELGGKARARKSLAEAETSVATLEVLQTRADLIFEVRKSFVELLSIEAALDNAHRANKLVSELARITNELVRLGAAPEVEQLSVGVELQRSELEIRTLERELKKARAGLSFHWGSREPRFTNVSGSLEDISPLPPLEELTAKLAQSVDMKLAKEGLRVSARERDVERTNGRSNIGLALGLGHSRETGNHTLIFGVGMPLSIFDRNRGNIAAAECALKRTGLELELFELETTTALNALYDDALSLREKITRIKNNLLPAAAMAHKAALLGYSAGKFEYSAVLDANAAVIELTAEYSEGLTEYALVRAEINRLVASGI